jgi:hypothetical protein
VWSLYYLALARQASDDLTGARELVLEALPLTVEAGDDSSTAHLLEALASFDEDVSRSGRLYGAAEALLPEGATAWPPSIGTGPRADTHAKPCRRIRERMATPAFQAGRKRGHRMDPQRAVRYALRGRPAGRQRASQGAAQPVDPR